MTCSVCGNRGVVRIGYQESPRDGYFDFGICRCVYGQRFRSENARRCLVASLKVDPDQVNLIEALLDPEDLTGFFPTEINHEVDVAEAGRRQRRPKL